VAADDIGDRGQWLCCLLLTQICPGRNEPYFRPTSLGDKHPIFDYLVELVGANAFFLTVMEYGAVWEQGVVAGAADRTRFSFHGGVRTAFRETRSCQGVAQGARA
jgi:hypothetical protein